MRISLHAIWAAAVIVLAGILGPVMATNAHAACGYGPPPPPVQTPEVFLHAIYDRYIGPEDKTQPIDYSQEAELRKYFEPSLVTLIMKDGEQAAKNGEVPALDGDPFIDAQEWDIKSFDIKVVQADADHADATIKFTNEGQPKLIHVLMARLNGQWKIHDIVWNGDEGTLRGLYARH